MLENRRTRSRSAWEGPVATTEAVHIPTPDGLELSDAVGPWLNSERVRRLMQGFNLR